MHYRQSRAIRWEFRDMTVLISFHSVFTPAGFQCPLLQSDGLRHLQDMESSGVTRGNLLIIGWIKELLNTVWHKVGMECIHVFLEILYTTLLENTPLHLAIL